MSSSYYTGQCSRAKTVDPPLPPISSGSSGKPLSTLPQPLGALREGGWLSCPNWGEA